MPDCGADLASPLLLMVREAMRGSKHRLAYSISERAAFSAMAAIFSPASGSGDADSTAGTSVGRINEALAWAAPEGEERGQNGGEAHLGEARQASPVVTRPSGFFDVLGASVHPQGVPASDGRFDSENTAAHPLYTRH